jgi:hypothetical protein
MTSFQDFDPAQGVNRALSQAGQPDMVVSMMTAPLLLGLVAGRAISDGLTQLGTVSEELFRGERLPTLSPLDQAAAPDPDR